MSKKTVYIVSLTILIALDIVLLCLPFGILSDNQIHFCVFVLFAFSAILAIVSSIYGVPQEDEIQ